MNLDVTKSKNISFEVSIEGIDYKLLEGALRINIEGVEYGFPITISNESIDATIPALSDVVKSLENGIQCEAKLEVYGEGFYLKPWDETLTLETPIKVEAKVVEAVEAVVESTPQVKVKMKASESKKVIKEKKVEKTPEQLLIEKFKIKMDSFKTIEEKKEFIKAMKSRQIAESAPKSKPKAKKKVPTMEINAIEDIHSYLTENNMKNRTIQTNMIDGAKMKSTDPDDLQEIFTLVQKMIS